jgi:hypothetical protein
MDAAEQGGSNRRDRGVTVGDSGRKTIQAWCHLMAQTADAWLLMNRAAGVDKFAVRQYGGLLVFIMPLFLRSLGIKFGAPIVNGWAGTTTRAWPGIDVV